MLSHMTSLSLYQSNTDLMDGLLPGQGSGWMVALKELRSTAQRPSAECRSTGVSAGAGAV